MNAVAVRRTAAGAPHSSPRLHVFGTAYPKCKRANRISYHHHHCHNTVAAPTSPKHRRRVAPIPDWHHTSRMMRRSSQTISAPDRPIFPPPSPNKDLSKIGYDVHPVLGIRMVGYTHQSTSMRIPFGQIEYRSDIWFADSFIPRFRVDTIRTDE